MLYGALVFWYHAAKECKREKQERDFRRALRKALLACASVTTTLLCMRYAIRVAN